MINNTLFRPAVLRENRKKFNPDGFDLAAVIKAREAAKEVPSKPADEQLSEPKPVLLGESELKSVSGSQAIELVNGDSSTDVDVVIRAAYRQVFGNAYLMDSERSPIAESQLRRGELTVLEFIRQLAKSDRYRTLFFESCTNLRAIELNFKHLLGRAPENAAEISTHVEILAAGGFEAEIDSYLDSDEYLQKFGTMVVPYYVGGRSQTGRSLASYTHAFRLLRGASASNKSVTTAGNAAAPQLQSALLRNQASEITPLPSLGDFVPVSSVPNTALSPEELLERAFKGVSFTPVGRSAGYYNSPEFLEAPKQLSNWFREYKAGEAASGLPPARKIQPVTLAAGAAFEDVEVVIRAAYRQVFGNAYLMESQRLLTAESQLKDGTLTVREFVRALAKSEIYRELFIDKFPNVRVIELNFKHLLGRAPDSGPEVSQHIITLTTKGLEADLDSYIDSDEYAQNFGDNTVPYYVGYATQTGKNGAGYNRIFQLVKGDCSSDKSVDFSKGPQVQKSLLKRPFFGPQPLAAVKPVSVLAKALGVGPYKADVSPPTIVEPHINAFAGNAPIELMAEASTQDLDVVIEAAYQQIFGNAYLMDSERLPMAESQLRSGQISVVDFVRLLAKSQRYFDLFFTPYTNVEAIKLNFKHLLGRAPNGLAEISEHVSILANDGFAAEIDSYLDSDEYFQTFGATIVPYYRGYNTQTGNALTAFTHSFDLIRGASSSNKSIARATSIQLDKSLLSNQFTQISMLSTVPKDGAVPTANTVSGGLTDTVLNLPSMRPVTSYYQGAVPTSSVAAPVGSRASSYVAPTPVSAQPVTLSPNQYEALENVDPIKWVPGTSGQEAESIILAVYAQVLGNAHVMESERLATAESQLKSGQLTIREFVRALAKSDLYKARFVDNSPRYRSHELNFKHLLGRAPDNFAETRHHSTVLDNQGYDADIDTYIDSDEYQQAFGENTVPYYRGYKTQLGQSMVGYTNMLRMLPSVSASDKSISNDNAPQVQTQILPKGDFSKGNLAGSGGIPSRADDLIKKALGLA